MNKFVSMIQLRRGFRLEIKNVLTSSFDVVSL